MSSQLRFDGKVAVVTGAGGGLGRAYALWFADRGAAVVVNDLGGSASGEGSGRAADIVVNEIKDKGGKAVADYNSVEEGDKIVKTAIDNYGRIDILVNNAGILRDKSVANTSDNDWDLIHRVHLRGSFLTTRAAWPHFRKQNYGRVIMTSSVAGIYGNFGQSNYSAAKLGLLGLSNTLSIEGKKYNIHCNTIVPMAGSRLTKGILPPDMMEGMRPDLVAPVVLWLCHDSCTDTGSVIEAAAGWVGKYRWERTRGMTLRESTNDPILPEAVRDNWEQICNFNNSLHPKGSEASMLLGKVLQDLMEKDANRDAKLSPVEQALNWRPPPVKCQVTPREIILYALSVGASTGDKDGLRYLYEGDETFAPIPTFGVLLAQEALSQSNMITGGMPGFQVDLSKVLHGEQYIEVHKDIPTSGTLEASLKVVDILDKKSGAVIVTNVEVVDETGDKVISAQWSIFVVGAGGFGGKRNSDHIVPSVDPPKRKPDASLSYKTSIDQAALYRLTGDRNPLHIDASFAAMGGFDRPILHGLASYGISCRLVLQQYADNNPALFKSMKARFSSPVLPGQTLNVDMWREGNRIHLETKVAETGKSVLTGAYIDLKSVASAPAPAAPTAASTGLMSEAVFAEMKRRLDAQPEVGAKINAVYQWIILSNKKPAGSWVVDLKAKPGNIYQGKPKGNKADCSLTLEDADMVALVTGKLNAQKAYMQGKLKIKGNIMLTQKLQGLLKENSKL
ncbi:peroxisomal multifunctional enzyme type 2-like [Daphnia carinata]|uniref:peroxisomal multifunctional enzyme type 2-like n=1 Tax=Daphnia carinata TaxID=120202 RepID=UPI00257D4191|nr:peroxisomal multifunctional enzyme type 2-like [Daphnia carinata]